MDKLIMAAWPGCHFILMFSTSHEVWGFLTGLADFSFHHECWRKHDSPTQVVLSLFFLLVSYDISIKQLMQAYRCKPIDASLSMFILSAQP